MYHWRAWLSRVMRSCIGEKFLGDDFSPSFEIRTKDSFPLLAESLFCTSVLNNAEMSSVVWCRLSKNFDLVTLSSTAVDTDWWSMSVFFWLLFQSGIFFSPRISFFFIHLLFLPNFGLFLFHLAIFVCHFSVDKMVYLLLLLNTSFSLFLSPYLR